MAQYTYDFGNAIQAGLTPDQINQYISQQKAKGNSYQLTNVPQATPQQSQQPKGNFIENALPTIGSVVGGIAGAALPGLGETGLGEVGGAAAGSALGEGAKELLEGQPLSAGNIATQGVLGGVGGAVGKGVGYVGGKILSKAGQALTTAGANTVTRAGELAGNVTPKVFDPVIPDDMNYADNMNNLATVAKNNGLMDGKPIDMIPKVKQTSQLVDAQLHSLPEMQNTFDVNAAQQDFMKQLADRNISPTDPRYASAIQNYSSKLANLGKTATDPNTPQILGADGQPVTAPGSATLADAYALKAATANDDLQRVFTKMKNPAGADLTPEERVQLALWNSLKGSMDAQGTPAIRQLNSLQNNLYSIGTAYAKAAGKNVTSGSGFSFKDLFPAGVGEVVGNALGAGGIPGAVGMVAATKALGNPTVVKAIGQGAQGAGQILQNGINPIVRKIASQTAGQSIARGLLPPTPQNVINQSSQYNQQNSPNQSNTLPSSPSQAGGNYNSTIQGSQALPATPTGSTPNLGGQPSYATGTASSVQNPLAGYTVNGQPIDPGTANLVYKIATYQIDPTKLASIYGNNNQREQLINLASQYNPNYDASEFPVKEKLRDSFTSGTQGQNVNSLNTAIGHLYVLSQMSNALGNGNITPLNAAKNGIATTFGSANVTNFNTTASAVAGEAAKVFKSSGATDSEIAQFSKGLNANMSPAQLQGNINTMIQLMASRLNALEQQYQEGMGQPPDSSFLSPESQQILQTLQTSNNSSQLPASPQ